MPDPLDRLNLAQQKIDELFGADYAREHPEVLVVVVQSAASDWAAARLAAAIEHVAITVLAQISTRLRKAGDFRGPVVPSRLWWRFSPPLFRSSPSAFVAAPRWNLSLLPCDIR